MPNSIPAGNFLCSLLSLLLILALPIGLCVYCARKHRGSLRAVLIGALCFMVGAGVLEQSLHAAVFSFFPSITKNAAAYCIYGCLAAGVFEETARLLGLRYLCKRDKNPTIGLAYGVGHGGIEALMLALTIFSNLMVMTTINSGNGASLLQGLDAATAQGMTAQLSSLATEPSWVFLMAGVERVFAVILHIALSMLIWMVVTGRVPKWGYPLSILLHALSDLPAVLGQVQILTNVLLLEALIGVLSVGIAAFVFWLYRKTAPAQAQTA